MGNTRPVKRSMHRARELQMGVQLRVEPGGPYIELMQDTRACRCGYHVCSGKGPCAPKALWTREYLGVDLGVSKADFSWRSKADDAYKRLIDDADRSIEHTVFGLGPHDKCAQAGCGICNKPALSRDVCLHCGYDIERCQCPPNPIAADWRQLVVNTDLLRKYAKPVTLVVDGVTLPPGWWVDHERDLVSRCGYHVASNRDGAWWSLGKRRESLLDAVMGCYGFERSGLNYGHAGGAYVTQVGVSDRWQFSQGGLLSVSVYGLWQAVAAALNTTARELYGVDP